MVVVDAYRHGAEIQHCNFENVKFQVKFRSGQYGSLDITCFNQSN